MSCGYCYTTGSTSKPLVTCDSCAFQSHTSCCFPSIPFKPETPWKCDYCAEASPDWHYQFCVTCGGKSPLVKCSSCRGSYHKKCEKFLDKCGSCTAMNRVVDVVKWSVELKEQKGRIVPLIRGSPNGQSDPWRSSEILHAVDAFTLITRSRTVVRLVGPPLRALDTFVSGFPVKKWRALIRAPVQAPSQAAPKTHAPSQAPTHASPQPPTHAPPPATKTHAPAQPEKKAVKPGLVKIAKRDGPLRQKQVRNFLQMENSTREAPDLLGSFERRKLPKMDLRTGLTPPTKVMRLAAPPSPLVLRDDEEEDVDNPAWLANDLISNDATRQDKFATFIQGHRARASRARIVKEEAFKFDDDLDDLMHQVEEVDRKKLIIRRRENTALDSEDDSWDENDLVS